MRNQYRKLDPSEATRLCYEQAALSQGDIATLMMELADAGLLPPRSRPTSGLRPGRTAHVMDIFGRFDPYDMMFPICHQEKDEDTVLVWKDRSRVGPERTNHRVLKVYIRRVGKDDWFLVYVIEADRDKDRLVADYYKCDQVHGVGRLMSDLGRLYPGLTEDYNLPA